MNAAVKPVNPNGCYNRDPLKEHIVVQAGWITGTEGDLTIRAAVMETRKDPMTKDCQYSILYGDDPRCIGCIHNQRNAVCTSL